MLQHPSMNSHWNSWGKIILIYVTQNVIHYILHVSRDLGQTTLKLVGYGRKRVSYSLRHKYGKLGVKS